MNGIYKLSPRRFCLELEEGFLQRNLHCFLKWDLPEEIDIQALKEKHAADQTDGDSDDDNSKTDWNHSYKGTGIVVKTGNISEGKVNPQTSISFFFFYKPKISWRGFIFLLKFVCMCVSGFAHGGNKKYDI